MPLRLNTSRAVLSASLRKFLASAGVCSVSRSDSIAAPFGNTGSGVLDNSSIHVSAPPPAPYRPWWACTISLLLMYLCFVGGPRSFDNQYLIWRVLLGLAMICLTVARTPSPPNHRATREAPVRCVAGALLLVTDLQTEHASCGFGDGNSEMMSPTIPGCRCRLLPLSRCPHP